MIYGYDTAIYDSESFQNIDDLARSLIGMLRVIGAAEPSAKPMILLAHSLGGLLVKTALVYLARCGEAELHMLQNIRLLVFFGVPHRGMHMEHLRTIVKGQPNQDLIGMLSPHSNLSSLLDQIFSGLIVCWSIRLVSAYETIRSHIAEVHHTKCHRAIAHRLM